VQYSGGRARLLRRVCLAPVWTESQAMWRSADNSEDEDAALVAAAREDAEAFRALYRRYLPITESLFSSPYSVKPI
jgi:hypothetical protein